MREREESKKGGFEGRGREEGEGGRKKEGEGGRRRERDGVERRERVWRSRGKEGQGKGEEIDSEQETERATITGSPPDS